MSALLLTRLASRCRPAPSTLAAALSTAPPRSPLSLPLLTAARHPPPAPPTTATILNRRLLRTSSIPSSLRSSLRSSSSRSISSLPESIAGVSICREWTPASTRVGALGMKCGMTQAWSAAGQRVPITMVELQDLQVVKRRTRLIDGVNALQLGGGWQKRKRLTLEAARAFEKRGLPYKRYLREFPVSEDAMLPVGATITARHFVPGQYVDAQGVTRGKGFAGVMKRWNFKGQPASHGHSLSSVARELGRRGRQHAPVSSGRKCTASGTCGGRVASPVVLFHSESCQRGPRAPPGVTPPSPHDRYATGGGRAQWAPMVPGGRERGSFSRAVTGLHVYSIG